MARQSLKELDTRNQTLQKSEHDMKEINFVIAKGMLHAETTSAVEEIETIAKLIQDNHQCADDDEAITVKPVLSGHPSGAPNENIVQNHLNIALLNVF